MATQRLTIGILLIFALLTPSASASLAQPVASPAALASPAGPGAMLLVENAGQWPEAARFQVWNSPLGAGTTWLAKDAIWLVVSRQVDWEPSRRDMDQVDKEERAHCDDPLVSLSTCLPVYSSHALKLTFPGSNPDVRIEPFEPLTTTVSYFVGHDPAQWRADVPVWGGVRYADLYPGIDLVLGTAASFWRWDAEPNAVTNQVRIQIEDAALEAVEDGMLRMAIDGAALSLALPQASFDYQVGGASQPDGVVISGAQLGLRAHQPAAPGDNPQDLIYSTFLGGSNDDDGYAIAVDGTGSAYVTGETFSSDFPTTPGAFDPSYNGGNSTDIFVARLNPAGSALIYATFLGGSRGDLGEAIAVDGAGSVYVTGGTLSSDFPTTPSAFDPSYNPNPLDGFVAKLNPAGSALIYATFIGGSNADVAFAIAVDGAGSAYVTGETLSGDFPTTPGAFDPSYNGGDGGDAFIARLNPAGSALTYGTFLGGSNDDVAFAIAVDGAGSAYVTGTTYSSNFPTTPGAFDPSFHSYDYIAYVAKLNPAGSALVYGTFLGGSIMTTGYAIAVDGASGAYVTGTTYSSDFPTTPGAFDPSYNYPGDAFVARLNPAGSALVYATFLGANGDDGGRAIAVDGAGSAYVTGWTSSSDFPTTPGAFDPSYNGGVSADAFIAKLNPAGSTLVYATFLGGSSGDEGRAIAVDGAGSAYVTGWTSSSDFPTTPGAFNTSHNGSEYDAIVAKLSLTEPMPLSVWHTEAEAGARTGSIVLGEDEGASACQYVYDTVPWSGSTVTFNVTAPYTDDYYLWARCMGGGVYWEYNSFFVSVDGAPYFHFEITPVNNQWVWKWQSVYDIAQPIVPYYLSAGAHTIRFASREPLARLDAVVLVNRSTYAPAQFTPCGPMSTSTATATASPSPTPTPMSTPTYTPLPTWTPTRTATSTPTPTASAIATHTPTPTATATPIVGYRYLPLIMKQ